MAKFKREEQWDIDEKPQLIIGVVAVGWCWKPLGFSEAEKKQISPARQTEKCFELHWSGGGTHAALQLTCS